MYKMQNIKKKKNYNLKSLLIKMAVFLLLFLNEKVT